MVENSITYESLDEKTDSCTVGAFRFTEESVTAIVQLVSACQHIETLRTLKPDLTKKLAQRTIFVPAIDPMVAEHTWHRPILLFAANADISGITLGSTVYLRSPHELSRWKLLVHEFVHVAQFHVAGPTAFLSRYASEYVQSRLRGQNDHDAYLGLRAELEARAAETPAQSYRPASLPYVVAFSRY